MSTRITLARAHARARARAHARVRRPAGFTLVEILVVVVILGILAAIVVPQFVSAASESREGSLKMDVYRIRQQIEIYRGQHHDQPPTLDAFVDQMTKATNARGDVETEPGASGFPFGPYLREIPVNPVTGGSTIGGPGTAIGASDWYYDETTGLFRANDSETNAAF